MSTFELLTGPLVEALGWALVHLLWQGALVAGILAAALSLLSRRSSNARYATACAALALLLILATITAVRSYEAHTPAAALPVAIAPAPMLDAIAAQPPAIADSAPSLRSLVSGARRYLPLIVVVWLAGVALLATRLIISWVRVQQMAREQAKSAAAIWTVAIKRLSRALGLRRAVRLLESAAVDVPTVIGWLRPVILLPGSTLTGLSPEQIEMLLAHELAHIRRNDFFINLLQAVVETLMFYHPAVWWISYRVRVERENCCDDLAVGVCGNAVQYARALTRLEELRAEVRYAAVAANGGSLMARIRRLIAAPREATAGAPRWAAGAAVLSVLIALIALPTLPMLANHDEQAPGPQKQASKPSSTEVEVQATEITQDPEDTEDPDAEAPDMDSEQDSDVVQDIEAVEAPAPPNPPARPHAVPRPAPPAPVIGRVHPMVAVAPEIAVAVAEGVEGALAEIDAGNYESDVDAKKFGSSGKLTVDELITLRANGVTPEYIEKMRAASLGELTLGQILAMRVQGVSPEYIRDLRAAGIDVRNAREVVALRVQGVSADYVQKMKAAGYKDLAVKELIAMAVQGVTPEYVQQMASAGYRSLTPRELVSLRVQGVTPAFIKALADAGYTNLSVKDIVRLAASGVNADFIREMAQYRDKK